MSRPTARRCDLRAAAVSQAAGVSRRDLTDWGLSDFDARRRTAIVLSALRQQISIHEPVVPLRRLIRRLGSGKVRVSLANATESFMSKITTLPALNLFEKNVYSQNGEDGIIEEMLGRISNTSQLDGWCVEFGAWDGIYLSNTYNLIKNKTYKAVLIEGNANKFKKLCKNIPNHDVIKICQFVSFDGDFTLDRLLEKTQIPKNFDILSIDIDGCDYFIFESLTHYRPKIVCIEFNPTIPNEVEFVQPRNFDVTQGASAKSLTKLAEKKSYTLVAITQSNLFFVDDQIKNSIIGSDNISLETLRDDSQCKSFIFCGYDGTILTNNAPRLIWHGIQLDHESLQKLPKYLRKYPENYNLLQRIVFELFLVFKFPKTRTPRQFFEKVGAYVMKRVRGD